MTMKRWNGSAMVDLTTAKRWSGSAWVDLTIAKRWTGAAWVDIPLPGGGGGVDLVVTTSPGSVSRAGDSGEEECPDYFTNSTTANATGGTPPYTYAWTYLSGSNAVFADTPTAATTFFVATLCVGTRQAVYQVKVTDSLGLEATATVDVTV